MRCRFGRLGATFLFVLGLLVAVPSEAKLPYLPLDYYVRHSDLVVTGRVETSGAVIVVAVEASLLGERARTVQLPAQMGWEEDEPTFAVGEDVLLFLERPKGGALACLQGMAGKVDVQAGRVKSFFFPAYERTKFVDLVRAFVAVREQPAALEKLRMLMRLIESDDVFVITSASSYLNFLVNGQDSEDWIIKPKRSEAWNYKEYYAKNAFAHKEAWQKWWLSRS